MKIKGPPELHVIVTGTEVHTNLILARSFYELLQNFAVELSKRAVRINDGETAVDYLVWGMRDAFVACLGRLFDKPGGHGLHRLIDEAVKLGSVSHGVNSAGALHLEEHVAKIRSIREKISALRDRSVAHSNPLRTDTVKPRQAWLEWLAFAEQVYGEARTFAGVQTEVKDHTPPELPGQVRFMLGQITELPFY